MATIFAIRFVFFKGILLSFFIRIEGESRISGGTARVYSELHIYLIKQKNTANIAVLNTNLLL